MWRASGATCMVRVSQKQLCSLLYVNQHMKNADMPIAVSKFSVASGNIRQQTRSTHFQPREDLRLGNNGASHPANKFDVVNPATGDIVASVADMDADDTATKIDAAYTAFEEWSRTPAKQRSSLLSAWFDAVTAETEYLAELMTAEQGKPLAEARGEVAYGASFLSWFSEEAKRLNGDILPAASANQKILVTHQPVGVCSLITPWNFPVAMITRKAGAALAAGCTAVIKPSEETPLSAEAIIALGHKVGIPKDVLSLVTCSRDNVVTVGEELSVNEKVRKVSFTGSTAVGKILAKNATNTMKRVSMELGGNAPFIVFDDADVDSAVEGAMASKFRNSGQTCVCANRFFVHSDVYDAFVQKLTIAVKGLVVGNGIEAGTTQGPLVNCAAVSKVDSLVKDAVSHGAQTLTGGAAIEGNFYEPTILADVTNDMQIAHDEIFGPVVGVQKFSSDEEVIVRANATSSGLAAYFYSANLRRIFNVAERLEFGMVGVNSGIISTEVAPFGGIKESGMGREGSKYGIAEYVYTKYVLLDISR